MALPAYLFSLPCKVTVGVKLLTTDDMHVRTWMCILTHAKHGGVIALHLGHRIELSTTHTAEKCTHIEVRVNAG